MSRSNFYLREHIIKFILEKGHTPTCAFMMYSYFLLDTVDRKRLIEATNDLLSISDELWVFGEISNGVAEEIKLANVLKHKISYFDINQNGSFAKKVCKIAQIGKLSTYKQTKRLYFP